MTNILPSINLVKKEKNFLDKFIIWSLSIGRVLIIITELIALSAFLYRFTLDRQLIDLHDKIKPKQVVLNLLKDNETKYRNLQSRLAIAAILSDQATNETKLYTDIIVLAPSDLTVNTFSISSTDIQIGATVLSINSLATFINNLKNYPGVDSVDLGEIQNKPSNATIVASIRATLKQK